MSDARNRDDSLERLLRKAKPMLGGASTPEACLDAETVAAWAAGGLSGDELERAQEHTAGCTRCQALVALMVRIDPATVVEDVPAPRSRAWIGWFVPLAAAAGLVLFLMTRPPGPGSEQLSMAVPSAIPPAPASTSLDAAQDAARAPRAAAEPAPGLVPVRPLVSGARVVEPSTVGGLSTPLPAGVTASATEAARLRQGTTGQLADADAATKSSAEARGVPGDLARSVANRAMPAGRGQAGSLGGVVGSASGEIAAPPPPAAAPVTPPPAAASAPITALRESVIVAAPPAAPATPAGPPPPPPAPPVIAQAPPAQAAFAGAGRGGAGGRGGGAAGGGGGGRGGAVAGGAGSVSVDAAASVEPRVVVAASPNSAVRWRATGALVERSTDGGATWQLVARVVDADFRAASSPSPLVCWLVGRDGKVVVFTEGRTARAITFPEMIDLTMVRATDDQIATVTAANGREYSTINGGLSWNSR